MTNILLSIIAVLLFARIVLQIREGKRAVEKGYASAYGVRKVAIVAKSADELYDRLCEKWEYCDYELVSVIEDDGVFYAFLQSKKIKNYYEE